MCRAKPQLQQIHIFRLLAQKQSHIHWFSCLAYGLHHKDMQIMYRWVCIRGLHCSQSAL